MLAAKAKKNHSLDSILAIASCAHRREHVQVERMTFTGKTQARASPIHWHPR
ncbi:MAG: hypothetical protein U1D30_02540 [Planctomycetota bacterium]